MIMILICHRPLLLEFYSMSGEILAARGVKRMSLEEVRDYMGPECPNVLEAGLGSAE